MTANADQRRRQIDAGQSPRTDGRRNSGTPTDQPIRTESRGSRASDRRPRRADGDQPARGALDKSSRVRAGVLIGVLVACSASRSPCRCGRTRVGQPGQPARGRPHPASSTTRTPRRLGCASRSPTCSEPSASCRRAATETRPPCSRPSSSSQALGVLLGTLPATGPGVAGHGHRPGRASCSRRICSTSSRNCAAPAPRRSSSAAVRVGVSTTAFTGDAR